MRHKRTIPTFICQHCGATVPRKYPSDHRAFCSRACANPHTGPRRSAPAELLFRKVEKTDTCWLFVAARTPKGYGQVWDGARLDQAHRLSWKLAAGDELPKGTNVFHTCDVRHCVRNDDIGTYEVDGVLYPRRGHLWVGPNRANSRDMVAKGRGIHPGAKSPARGERHPSAKLSDAAVAEIRTRFAEGERQVSLVHAFGISAAQINALVHNRSRK